MATDSSHRVVIEKCCQHSSPFIFDWIFFILAVMRTTIRVWMSYKFGQIRLRTAELAALECLRKCYQHPKAFIFDQIFFVLASNQDKYKSTDEFEIQLNLSMDCRVSCP